MNLFVAFLPAAIVGLAFNGYEGTGKCFAVLLAAQGIHVILVARSAEPLGETAAAIRGRFSVQVHPCHARSAMAQSGTRFGSPGEQSSPGPSVVPAMSAAAARIHA